MIEFLDSLVPCCLVLFQALQVKTLCLLVSTCTCIYTYMYMHVYTMCIACVACKHTIICDINVYIEYTCTHVYMQVLRLWHIMTRRVTPFAALIACSLILNLVQRAVAIIASSTARLSSASHSLPKWAEKSCRW